MRTFFVCGTPRSRTAWLANLLTTEDSFCFHELLAECKDVSEMKEKFENTGKLIVGNSDSGNTLFVDKIYHEFKNPIFIVVKRNREDVKQSLINFDIGLSDSWELNSAIDLYFDAISNLEKNYECFSFNWKKLHGYYGCNMVFKSCIGKELDYNRWKLLSKLNIQADRKIVMQRMNKTIENVSSLIEN